jgi:hypothetical protein
MNKLEKTIQSVIDDNVLRTHGCIQSGAESNVSADAPLDWNGLSIHHFVICLCCLSDNSPIRFRWSDQISPFPFFLRLLQSGDCFHYHENALLQWRVAFANAFIICPEGIDGLGDQMRIPKPSYSPNIAPSDFVLFGYLKKKLTEYDIPDRVRLKLAITHIFSEIGQETLIPVLELGSNDSNG